MKWLVAGDTQAVSERLTEAREMLTVGLSSEPENNKLLVAFGFIEKTQAQVARAQGDTDGYVERFGEAARYFGKALANDPTDVGALNGMVNVYISNKDYDSAIKLGRFATFGAPDYGAAFWDLAIAYEKKLMALGEDRELIEQLIQVYDRLLTLMPQEPGTFSAKDLVHVQERLAVLRK
jgi:tetratricopeptide (TPR) repeat protein